MSPVETSITVNGKVHNIPVKPSETLLHTLRERLGLLGVKQSCDYGGCGACTVIVDGKAVYSCMTLTAKTNEGVITTVEGLGTPANLHPLQKLFMEEWALQCGFCTPGILLSSKSLLDAHPNPSESDIREALAGHLCRCTGFVTIVKAVKKAAVMKEPTSS